MGKDNKNSSAIGSIDSKEVFMVRHIDPDKERVSQVGPFQDKEEAINTCQYFLKRGKCSWLVRCNG